MLDRLPLAITFVGYIVVLLPRSFIENYGSARYPAFFSSVVSGRIHNSRKLSGMLDMVSDQSI